MHAGGATVGLGAGVAEDLAVGWADADGLRLGLDPEVVRGDALTVGVLGAGEAGVGQTLASPVSRVTMAWASGSESAEMPAETCPEG